MNGHRGRGVTWAIAAVLAAGGLMGCGDGAGVAEAPSGVRTATPVPAGSAGPFNAAELVPAGYRVVSTTPMALAPGQPDYQVVISENPDANVTDAGQSGRGATQNVQVFAFRDGAWAEVFDAADRAVPYAMQGDFGAPADLRDETPDPVLNQKDRLDGVSVQRVTFAADHPALAIYGEDKANPEVLGVLAVVDFLAEKANLDHYAMAHDLGKPKVVGGAAAQQLEVPNYWYPWLQGGDPQQYTQTVGMSKDDGVAVIGDSRPWIGVWVGVGTGPGVMVSRVIAGSPAEGALDIGDRIASVNGNNPQHGLGPELLALHPGDEVELLVLRGSENLKKTLVLSDMSKAPTHWQTPTPATIGVRVAPLSGRPGIAVTKVAPGSPAAKAGLAAGDAIQRIGHVPTGSPADLDAALNGRGGEELQVEIQKADGTTRTVTVTPTEEKDGDGIVALL
ncbi:MAG TPA: PDZ domain-containing protein [Sporichthya sp.]|nr:PDZ domain-containing protein [Sporichthya sp.]